MPITKTQLISRAVRQARAGLSAEESRVYEDVAMLHLDEALQDLIRSCEHDQKRRIVLSKRFALGATEMQPIAETGLVAYALSGKPQIWLEGLRYATVYPMQGETITDPLTGAFIPQVTTFPMQWEANAQLGNLRGTDTTTGTYWVEDGYLFVALPLGLTPDYISITTQYIPDFSTDYPVPAILEDDAIRYLAQRLTQNAPPAESKNAAADK